MEISLRPFFFFLRHPDRLNVIHMLYSIKQSVCEWLMSVPSIGSIATVDLCLVLKEIKCIYLCGYVNI